MKLFLFIFLCLPLPLHALTLPEVVEVVLKNHPSLQAAQASLKGALAEKKAAPWLPDPEIGIKFEEAPLEHPGFSQAKKTSLSASQEIPFPGKLITQTQISKEEIKVQKALLTREERQKIFETKKTYFELIANQHQIQAQENILQSYRTLLASIEKNYQMNTSPSPPMGSPLSDLYMMKMKKAESEALLHDLHHQHHALEAKLNLMMGMDAMAPLQKLKEPSLKTLKGDPHTLEEKLLHQNADLSALAFEWEKAKKEITQARLSYVPDLRVEASHDWLSGEENAYSVGMALNLPLWIPKNQAQVDRAKALKEKSRFLLETEKINLKEEMHYLIQHAQEHRSIVQKYRNEIVPYARSAWKLDFENYTQQQGNLTLIIEKLVNFSNAEIESWKMWLDYQVSYAALEMLIGEEL